jgi:hypothetical protein
MMRVSLDGKNTKDGNAIIMLGLTEVELDHLTKQLKDNGHAGVTASAAAKFPYHLIVLVAKNNEDLAKMATEALPEDSDVKIVDNDDPKSKPHIG